MHRQFLLKRVLFAECFRYELGLGEYKARNLDALTKRRAS
jgi:hypothetical protein